MGGIKRKTDIVRISIDLISEIKDIANKNNLGFTDASREMARGWKNKFKNRKITRDIQF